MSNKASFFPTGSNCKLIVNGVTLAFAIDFKYTIKIKHHSAKILGVYEADTQEPLAYDVNGNFTVIRYIEGMAGRLTGQGFSVPSGVSNLGNGVGSWTVNQPNDIVGTVKSTGNFTNDGRANEALNPAKLHTATWFDIAFYQNTSDGNALGIALIKNCRITQVDSGIMKRGVFMQTFSFVANSVDEDSFLANPSGIGQTNA